MAGRDFDRSFEDDTTEESKRCTAAGGWSAKCCVEVRFADLRGSDSILEATVDLEDSRVRGRSVRSKTLVFVGLIN